MKKLLCVFAVFVFLPCSVPAAEGTDMAKPFQIAKSYKFSQMEKQDFYSQKHLLNNRQDAEGASSRGNIVPRTCPAGEYRKGGGACVPFCTGISCTNGGRPTPVAGGCCCQ